MKPNRQDRPRPKQQTSKEILDSLLDLIRRKFYPGEPGEFAKDRRRLLQWVVLWPAREWFAEKAVAVPGERYREILSRIIIEAAAHQAQEIKYRPAWLARTVQSHFAVHGEEIYQEAKSARTLAEHALLTLGKLPVQAQDRTVSDFTAASVLLDRKKVVKPAPRNGQLSLL